MSNPEPLPFEAVFWPHSQKRACWVFDLDGTLIDLAPRPDAVKIPDSLLADLKILRASEPVAIVSGRALSDLEFRIPISALTLVGNHGAEWRLDGRTEVIAPDPEALRALNAIRPRLKAIEAEFPGALLEDKQWTMSFHVRSLSAPARAVVEQSLGEVVSRYASLSLREANACWEIRPPSGATKGDAVRTLLDTWPSGSIPLVFGDDRTDEDAFQAGAAHGVTIIVGDRRPTSAQFHLPSPSDLRQLLHRIVSRPYHGG